MLGPAARGTAGTSISPSSTTTVTVRPVFAGTTVSWYGFRHYWMGFIKNSDRVVVIVALVAASALFIITRGKWMKN